MVSTRSGRTTSAEPTSFGRITRSRARKESEAIHDEDAAADLGQPEVTSPALPLNYMSPMSTGPSPEAFGGFGSPLATDPSSGTPIHENMLGTPFQERVVKTIGRGSNTPARQSPPAAASRPTTTLYTPAPASRPATTPSAKEVLNIAAVPLPEDPASGSSEPFASSDDEPVGPASPHEQAACMPLAPDDEEPSRRRRGLFGAFAFSSIIVTVLIALLLSPCLDRELYASVESRNYERVCKTLVVIHNTISNRFENLSALFVERVDGLRRDLPPKALEVLEQTWVPVHQAHLAAWTVLNPLVNKAKQHARPLWEHVLPKLQHTARGLILRVVPYFKRALEYAMSPAASNPITGLNMNDLITILDPQLVQREYIQELWHKAALDRLYKQKATMWLLTCSAKEDCSAATQVLRSVAVSILHIDGTDFSDADAAGQMQRNFTAFLSGHPDGVVLVTSPENLHPNSLAVLCNAVSEAGHLQVNGQPLQTQRALFLLVTHHQVDHQVPSINSEASAKDWIVQSIAARGMEMQTMGIVRSFRRRVDAVLPIRAASEDSS